MTKLNRVILGNTLTELKKLPDNIFDVGVTSPPYNKGEKDKGWLVENVMYKSSSDKLPEKEYQRQQINVLNELYRITTPGGSFFYDHKLRWRRGVMTHPYSWVSKTKWTVRQEIIWNRKIAGNIRGWRFWQIEERIFWLYKPEGKSKIGKELNSKHALMTSVWEIRPENKVKHPAPFPIELPTRCIYSILDGETGNVIDPYSGSGTTLVSAKLLGCEYLGIEISKEYVEMSKERLKNCENERVKIQMELERHIVKKTFKDRKEEGLWLGKNNTVKKTKELKLDL